MNRRALLIGVAGALALLVLWYVVLWSPTASKLDDARERKQTAEEQASQLRSQIQRLRQSQNNQAQQQAKLTAQRASIPDTPKLGEFILDVNDAAVKSGIDFISVAPSVPTAAAAAPAAATTATTVATAGTTTAAPTGPAEIKLALQIQGGYFQVLDFLNRLDALPRLVVTDSLNVTADNTPTARLTVAVTARIFTRAVPPEFGGAATTATTVAGGATTTTVAGGATTTTAAGATTTTGVTR